ncbi:MAG: CHAD domain-containing protein [Xanthobacteraceae bacterium]
MRAVGRSGGSARRPEMPQASRWAGFPHLWLQDPSHCSDDGSCQFTQGLSRRLSERTRATITDRLEGFRKTSEMTALDAKTLQRLRHGLALASAGVSAWPLERMTFEDVATALARSYRRTRRRLPRNWATTSAEDIHEFRKAVVTFRYQIELFEPLWPKVSRTLTNEVQKLRAQLGKSNDLVVLGALTRPRQPLARWRSRLALPIESLRQFHLDRARRLARRLFAETPRSFQKRIGAKSLAPPLSA